MPQARPWRSYIGELDAIATEGRVIVQVEDLEIGVFAIDGDLYAYENRCPHQGGPVCRGTILPRVTDDWAGGPSENIAGTHDIACPWHGWEYDITTGCHIGRSAIRLRSFPVIVEGERVFVELGG